MDSIEGRLTDWGLWAGGFGRGSGYSTPHARMITLGILPQASPDNWSQFPPEIEQTERAIAQLKIHSKYLKTLIFQRYLYRLQVEEIATNLDRNKDEIERGLDKARDWIGDWLDYQTSRDTEVT
jgi:hypothetical protein